MTILQIVILTIAAVGIGRLRKGRSLVLLAVSVLAVFWLQPAEPYPTLVYWLPVATLAIVIFSWALTSNSETRGWRQNWSALAVMACAALLVDLNHYFRLTQVFTADTPNLRYALMAIAVIAAVAFSLARWQKANRFWRFIAFIGIILIFIFLKSPALLQKAMDAAAAFRGRGAGDTSIAFAWLGFSYLAFRILHTIRDRQTGRLPSVTLAEYVNYVLFFPSFTEGPIDRLERFVRELRVPLPLASDDWLDAGTRLFVGLFKKFVVADLLAVISISDVLVTHVNGAGWLWLFLYAYTFRIYFDFSGYTDIAIGIGRLAGIRLPENFLSPYLKPNLTQFWNSWHITLTQWFRAYFFNPLTRALRSSKISIPVWIIILVTQISTMVLIGLWHGIAAGFVAWGLWHGIGLFIQNRWSEFIRPRLPAWTQTRRAQTVLNLAGMFLTFHFVALGWLFFTLSTPAMAWQALQKLFGIA
jgi:alginate O-acetyltransferase complex protein AlgI